MTGRHQGTDTDRLGTALTVRWAAGHLAAAFLLGFAAQTQQHDGPEASARPALTEPDTPLPLPAAW
ncbi:hypothetical protein [Streptacidiphilus cavernicola]|uniref:MFS transporter n=1 Tax=Streptacidiphilus cavernicola TaxID=3342716 RepID=A0ABV6W5M1_9ACTN